MQIISGKYRARKLIGVDTDTTRPTLARVKESIFNIIQNNIDDSVVLDLFAGSGAFGAECISRNAKKVYFVDFEQKAINTIKINTKNMIGDFEILKNDYREAISNFSNKKITFDIIYLDPPYKSDFTIKSLKLIEEKNLLSDSGIVVIEHENPNDLDKISKYFKIVKSKKYGIAYVDILIKS